MLLRNHIEIRKCLNIVFLCYLSLFYYLHVCQSLSKKEPAALETGELLID